MNPDPLHPEAPLQLDSPLGLVSGNGCFPEHFIRNAKARGYRVIVIAHLDETLAEGVREADHVAWIRVGQLGRVLRTFERQGVRNVAFLGGIRKARLLKTLRPDWTAMRFMCSLPTTNDNDLLTSLARFFEARGFSVFDPTVFLENCRAPRGVFSRRAPSQEECRQASIGWQAAQVLGQADVGQAVVVAAGSVVAVEAIEGTDELLKRAGGLVGTHPGVLIKRVKPQQDLRLDLPTIGPSTVRNAANANIKCIIVEADQTLLVEPVVTVRIADELGVCLIGAHGAELAL